MAQNIKLAIFDFDGVFTDGNIYFDQQGNPIKKYNTRDAVGLRLVKNCDIKIGVVSGYKDNIGPRYGFADTNDLGWAVQKNAYVLLVVPGSNQIATFNPFTYSNLMKSGIVNEYNSSDRNRVIAKSIMLRNIK